jgi:conjugal transfer pilus assembly protein TraW
MIKIALVSAALTLCLSQGAWAKDLGALGEVYPVSEQDFLVFIHERLSSLQQSGQLAQFENQSKKRVVHDALNPPPVMFLTTTNKPTVHYYDPTFVLDRNIYNAQGQLLFAKGTQVNPLNVVPLNETLIFFDGRDPRQVNWAKAQEQHYRYIKFILTGGNIKTQTQLLGRVYFDQGGKLSQKLGITNIPDVITQDHKRLKIQEIGTPALDHYKLRSAS